MTQEILNSTNNIQIPHSVSFWFQNAYAGDFLELGDLIVDGVSITPDFLEFRSYRNGLNALRKRLLQAKNASITLTLNEPNIYNLQRVVYGSAVSSGATVDVLEGRHLQVIMDGQGDYVSLADAGESDFANITVTGIYAVTDVLHATNLISSDISLDTDGRAIFDATDTGVASGQTVYVTYTINTDSMYSSEIFGASNATIEGAAKLQARNTQGGVVQIWDLASVQLAPNGDMTLALDAVQTIPMLATLQERSGTFGTVYAK
jgi:hypothetical protein